ARFHADSGESDHRLGKIAGPSSCSRSRDPSRCHNRSTRFSAGSLLSTPPIETTEVGMSSAARYPLAPRAIWPPPLYPITVTGGRADQSYPCRVRDLVISWATARLNAG